MSALVIIILYLAALLGLGLFSNRLFRGTAEDYMLASHSIGPFFLLMSLFGTTMTAFALVGSTGEAFKSGVGVYGKLASASGIVHSMCFFLVGIPLWRLGKRLGFSTQVEFFRARLDNRGIGLLLFPALVGLVIPYLLIGILGGGSVVAGATGTPAWAASLVICCVVLIYVFFGGMRGTAWANALQTVVFMILGVVTFFVIAQGLGQKDSLLASMQAASAGVSESKLTREGMSKITYASYLLIPLSVGMFPHVFQHWLTAKSAETFKLPIVLHPIFILIVWLPCVMVGVWATNWPADFGETPPPNQVLAILVAKTSGEVLTGLLTAGILAAIMSSLDSQFLCLGTMFTKDIVLEYGGEDRWKDHEQVWIARTFVVAVVAVTYGISLVWGASVFVMGIWCFSGFTGLFPLVVAALYWRRLTAAGAYACIITTAIVWAWMFVQSDFGQNRAFSFPAGSHMLPVVTITVCSTIALIVVSLLTKPPKDKVLDQFFTK